ncbi:hypothetical protein GCM10009760_18970 [Kitasatospora kazusensis]|uniref:Plasmid replication/partition related protein n=1 Tax=Kitasatospora kazusensis TaxID=407974 RepID=A0ABN2Z7V5_9ACTN
MLPEHELHDLAQSIKTSGLLMPIVLDPDGVLLDGRNRLAACELAGVEPRFATYTGTDQRAYIWLSNVRRRHVTEGQRAMVHAMVLSASGHSLRTHAALHAISRSRLSLANTVLKNAPDLAERVRDGKIRLDAAHDIVRQRKAEAAAIQAQHDNLLRHAPDLAAQVTEGHFTLDAATATLAERQKAVRADQQHLTTIAEHWDTLQHLARHPDSLHTQQVLDGLTTEARALADHLITLEARAEEAHQHS